MKLFCVAVNESATSLSICTITSKSSGISLLVSILPSTQISHRMASWFRSKNSSSRRANRPSRTALPGGTQSLRSSESEIVWKPGPSNGGCSTPLMMVLDHESSEESQNGKSNCRSSRATLFCPPQLLALGLRAFLLGPAEISSSVRQALADDALKRLRRALRIINTKTNAVAVAEIELGEIAV